MPTGACTWPRPAAATASSPAAEPGHRCRGGCSCERAANRIAAPPPAPVIPAPRPLVPGPLVPWSRVPGPGFPRPQSGNPAPRPHVWAMSRPITPAIPFSLLDLAPVTEGSTPAQAFANSLDLARHAEALGSARFWLAEHHNMPGIASAATAVLIGHIAGGTSTIRVGAGGVMLPNHAPLQVAEQFGTLTSLYPDRIDLGL